MLCDNGTVGVVWECISKWRCGSADVLVSGGVEVRRCGGAEVELVSDLWHHPPNSGQPLDLPRSSKLAS